jgi:hypothetical protein
LIPGKEAGRVKVFKSWWGGKMRRFVPVGLFAICFAYVESAVVVYLRLVYYPDGFQFPLILMPPDVAEVELGRELATLGILVWIGWISGETGNRKFFYGVFAFGLWDIFYYVWLWVFLGWPPSLFTFDVLFLIPVVWVGPVLAPVIVAVSLCAASLAAVHMEEKGKILHIHRGDHLLLWVGALVIVLSFTWNFRSILEGGLPGPYRWEVFWVGEILGIASVARVFLRTRAPAGR